MKNIGIVISNDKKKLQVYFPEKDAAVSFSSNENVSLEPTQIVSVDSKTTHKGSANIKLAGINDCVDFSNSVLKKALNNLFTQIKTVNEGLKND